MATAKQCREIAKHAQIIRKNILCLALHHKIHIGGDLSVADVMATIWGYKMRYRPEDPKWEQRDRFVLSKGHGAAVTFLSQAAIGCYSYDEIANEYATDFGRFGMHSCNLLNPHVEVSTGSLGHGLPVSVGIAQALRLKQNFTSRVYTVVGDGEAEEGSVWEAISLAKKLRLGNLVCFFDANGLQCSGPVSDVSSLLSLSSLLAAFGWRVVELDGHSIPELTDFFDGIPPASSDTPVAVIAHTTKGKGVSFMENRAEWHNGVVTQAQYKQAMEELELDFVQKWGKTE